MWLDFFSVLSALICTLCVPVAIYAARRAIQVSASQEPRWRSAVSQLQLLKDSLDETQNTLTDLANRVKMQRVRTTIAHGQRDPAAPDPYKDPEGWRKMMNAQIAANKFRSPS